MSGFLRNLSAQALGRSASVRSVARLPYAAPPAMSELPASEHTSLPPADVVASSVAAPPNAADRTARGQPRTGHELRPLLPRRHDDASVTPHFVPAVRRLTDRETAAPTPHPLIEPAAPAPLPTPPALIPTAPHIVPQLVTRPLAAAAAVAGADRQSGAETTEVHVSIGRIELIAVHEAAPPPRRAAPARPSVPLRDYLSRRQGRPS